MKLATYKDGSRDGQLVVVSRDLSRAHYATGIATRLHQVLDDWNFLAPQLQALSSQLDQGRCRNAFPFEPEQCMAPLPRVGRWVAASNPGSHVERLSAAWGRPAPERLKSEPLLEHRAGDLWLGPCDDVHAPSGETDLDLEPEVAVLCGAIEPGVTPDQALEGVRLLMLTCGWVARAREAEQHRRGWGGVLERGPASAAPVAVTPDELGGAWQRGRLDAALRVTVNDRLLGHVPTADAQFHAGQILALLARGRPLPPGLLLGLGVPSQPGGEAPVACLLERREQERSTQGEAVTPWLADGDPVRVEVHDARGLSPFGAIATHLIV